MAELTDLKLWLWNNSDGLHVTAVTNYRTPYEKRSFLSFSGENTRQGFKAYRDKQPEPLKEWFAERRPELESARSYALDSGWDCRVSKLVENTGTGGRRVLRGCMLLMQRQTQFEFLCYFGDHRFIGEFSPDLLSGRQLNMSNCVGAYFWRKPTEEENDYGEAF